MTKAQDGKVWGPRLYNLWDRSELVHSIQNSGKEMEKKGGKEVLLRREYLRYLRKKCRSGAKEEKGVVSIIKK